MRIGIYGGAFNPPHRGHVSSSNAAVEELDLDKLLVIPSGLPPHKTISEDSPGAAQRYKLTRLAFEDIPKTEVSDIEIMREGKSYTVDTIEELKSRFPGAEFFMLLGTDMFITLPEWHNADKLLRDVTPVIASRYRDIPEIARETYTLLRERGIETIAIRNRTLEISSSELRGMLGRREGREYLMPSVYKEIIKNGYYGAKPDFDWLRFEAYKMLDEKRIRHVAGCEAEAVSLSKRWGVDTDSAREAAILHDITKKLSRDEHLEILNANSESLGEIEQTNEKLMHAKTGALIAKSEFNVNGDVMDAILWHTTGKAQMTPLEMIIYIADYIEPNRDYDEPWFGVLKRLAYENLGSAMRLGLEKSIEDLRQRGKTIHPDSLSAFNSISECEGDSGWLQS